MANICTNMLYVSTDNRKNYDMVLSEVQRIFECYYTDEYEDMNCEMEFESKWDFPVFDMKEITGKLEPDDTMYIRVLSYELASEYVGFHIFKNGQWVNKLNNN